MRNGLFMIWVIIFFLLNTSEVRSLQVELPLERAEVLLQQANKEMERVATHSSYEDKEKNLRRAVQIYLRLDQSGYSSGALYYNLGNCYMRLRETGEAIYWYRQAGRLIPGNRQLHANIRYARSQTQDKFPVNPGSELVRTLFFFHYLIPLNIRLNIFIFFWNVLWVVLIACMFVPRLRRLWIILPFIFLSFIFSMSYGVDRYRNLIAKEGVVIRNNVLVLKGASRTFGPALNEPINQGAEVRVMESRNDYNRVVFSNGVTGWIPETTIRILD